MWQYVRTNEICHWGILGMKWGVRRWQNKDGSLTPAGYDHYGYGQPGRGSSRSSTSSSNGQIADRAADLRKYRQSLSEKTTLNKTSDQSTQKPLTLQEKNYSKEYQKKYGLTKEEADEAARRKTKVYRNVAIGAATAAAVGVGIYFAVKYGREHADNLIRSGTTLQTVSDYADRIDYGTAFYTASNKFDKIKYVGLFGKTNKLFNPGDYKLILKANVAKDIKVAGIDNGKKVYNELLLNNKDFKDSIMRTLNNDRHGFKILSDKKTGYNLFNQQFLVNNSGDNSDIINAQKIFYNTLKQKGYGAVADVNDRALNGFKTHAHIVFDRDNLEKYVDSLGVKVSYDSITEKQYNKARKQAIAMLVGQSLATPSTIIPASIIAKNSITKSYGKKIANEYKKN